MPLDYRDTCPYLDVAHGPSAAVDSADGTLFDQPGIRLNQTTLAGKTIFKDHEYTIIRAWTLTREPDQDNDGVPNGRDNCLFGYNPDQADVNGDGIGDACESTDTDVDGLSDADEMRRGTDPQRADTDDDGLSDGDEVHVHNTDPLARDSDGDGVSDGDEVKTYSTDPTSFDSDGDGYSDGAETGAGTDPSNPGDKPLDKRRRPVLCTRSDTGGQSVVTIGNAVAVGCFVETRPGSGFWFTDDAAQIGGIDVRPRAGQRLTLDTRAKRVLGPPTLQIAIGGQSLPFAASRLPVASSGITTELKGGGRSLLNGLLPMTFAPKIALAWEDGGLGSSFTTTFDASRLPVNPARYGVQAGGGTAELHLKNGIGVVRGKLAIGKLEIVPGEAMAGASSIAFSDVGGEIQYTKDGYLWTARATAKVANKSRGYRLTVGGTLRWLERKGLVGFGARLSPGASAVGRLGLSGGSFDFISSPGFGLIGTVEGGLAVGRKGRDPLDIKVNGRLGGGRFVLQRCTDPLGGSAFEGSFDAGGKIDGPGSYKLSGSMKLDICTFFSTGYSRISTEGTLSLVHEDDPGDALVALTERLEGYIFDPTSGEMQLNGTGQLRLPFLPDIDARVSWSDFALAACGKVGWLAEAGFAWYYQADQLEKFTSCDLGPYQSQAVIPAAGRLLASARAQAASSTLPAGLSVAAFRVRGVTTAPAVTLDGPGSHIVIPAGPDTVIQTADYIAVRSEADATTQVFVRAPAAGSWSVEVDPTLAGFATVEVAQSVPMPRISASVKVAGGRRRLSYEMTLHEGQAVRFVDRTGDAARIVATTTTASGSLPLPALTGKSRLHRIEATVLQNDLPRSTTTVASYRAAPATVGPGPVVGLGARRAGRVVTVRWKAAKRARRYFVVVRVGRTIVYSHSTNRRSVRAGDVPAGTVTVAVRGVDASGRYGPVARRTVRR